MTRFGTAVERVDVRTPGIDLPLLSVSQTRGVLRRSELTDKPPRAESLDVYKVCRKNDIVFNKMSIRSGAMGVAKEDGLVTYHYEVMRPRPGTSPDYIVYLMKSAWFTGELIARERGIGAGDAGGAVRTTEVPFKVLRNIDAHIPIAERQRVIADYLDHETAQIDTLIAKQEQLIATLRERRGAVLELPFSCLGWSVPMRSVASLIQTGPFGSQLKSDEYEPGGTPVINPSHVVAGRITPDANIAASPAKAAELARHAFKQGDLVVARRGELGRCAVATGNEVGYLCGTGSALVRPHPDRLDSRFLALAYGTRRNRDALSLASVGATMENVNGDIIGGLRVPVPPLEMQRRIVEQINERTAKIDALIAKTERFIKLSKERRTALITAAVTGRIDVRVSA